MLILHVDSIDLPHTHSQEAYTKLSTLPGQRHRLGTNAQYVFKYIYWVEDFIEPLSARLVGLCYLLPVASKKKEYIYKCILY